MNITLAIIITLALLPIVFYQIKKDRDLELLKLNIETQEDWIRTLQDKVCNQSNEIKEIKKQHTEHEKLLKELEELARETASTTISQTMQLLNHDLYILEKQEKYEDLARAKEKRDHLIKKMLNTFSQNKKKDEKQ